MDGGQAYGRANGWPGQISRVRTISSTYGRTGHGRRLRGRRRRYVQNSKLNRTNYVSKRPPPFTLNDVYRPSLPLAVRVLFPGAATKSILILLRVLHRSRY